MITCPLIFGWNSMDHSQVCSLFIAQISKWDRGKYALLHTKMEADGLLIFLYKVVVRHKPDSSVH